MKKLLLLLFLLLSIVEISACSCIGNSFSQNYQDADVIGVVKIVKVYDQNKQRRTYKVDIEFEEIFKGKSIKTIIVSGLIGKSKSAACELNVKPQERYLIYLQKYDNIYSIDYCTPKSKLQNRVTEDEKSWFEYLGKAISYLEKNKSGFQNLQFATCYQETPTDDKSDLSKISDFNPKQEFAIYKVKVNNLAGIQEISPIAGFSHKDETIRDILKTKFKVDMPHSSSDSEPKEFLLFLCYDKNSIEDPESEVIYSD
ncbi:hypothetical protein C1637_22035 [Chryseobacterium lactis]|uniref:Uncharacterized protein n=1 Tax=Chryseobacterium lactis TaxID=1241981 RepID=A0A3G6RUZ1_CHRLC|nr:hypothetical protein [Chryseobacterium lactis]AZA84962.1 hypothetical protein EG342_24995 [Chryseobacterium lactis]AZB05350.1 hypothetical protein EG341_15875 [Chryseobacterium lactis]PNW11499.1 hypothetical protein C1637_22035 [Chryseobacterium lactis]